MPMTRRMIAMTIPRGRRMMDSKVIRMAPRVSPAAMIGLAVPAVRAELLARRATVLLWTMVEVPPPAMMARVQWSHGEMSERMPKVMTLPATAAAGVAMVSRRLSRMGTK